MSLYSQYVVGGVGHPRVGATHGSRPPFVSLQSDSQAGWTTYTYCPTMCSRHRTGDLTYTDARIGRPAGVVWTRTWHVTRKLEIDEPRRDRVFNCHYRAPLSLIRSIPRHHLYIYLCPPPKVSYLPPSPPPAAIYPADDNDDPRERSAHDRSTEAQHNGRPMHL